MGKSNSNHIEAFFRKAINDERLLPSHVSLFIAILYHSPDKKNQLPFQVCRRKLMRYSFIRSTATYHKCICELETFGYIQYKPSYHPQLGSQVGIIVG